VISTEYILETMKKNRGVVYKGPGVVAVEEIPYPTLELKEQNRKCPHGVIVKVSVLEN
jgi:glutathione-independent formaldehyde dehydrogenase